MDPTTTTKEEETEKMAPPSNNNNNNNNKEEEEEDEEQHMRRMSHMVTPPRRRPGEDDNKDERFGLARKPSIAMLTTSEQKGVIAPKTTTKDQQIDAKVSQYLEQQQQQLDALDLEEKTTTTTTTATTFGSPRGMTRRQNSIQWFQRRSSRLVLKRNLPAGPSQRRLSSSSTTSDNNNTKADGGGDGDANNDNNNSASTTTTTTKANDQPQKSQPPQQQQQQEEEEEDDKETVAVFNANTPNGKALVRGLAQTCHVVAIVRVFTSKNAKELLETAHVTVKVADLQDADAVIRALGGGVHRAFLCLRHWQEFSSQLEEQQARVVLNACAVNRVPHLVLSTFEDTKQLRKRGLKSQIVPDAQGRIQPKFRKMKPLKRQARLDRVQLTHMITSYLDQEKSKKCLCLIMGENGKLIVQPHFQDV